MKRNYQDTLELIGKNDPGIFSFDLSGQKLNDDDILKLCEALEKNPYVITLHLNHNNIGPKGAESLSRLKHLKELNLGHNHVGTDGAKSLATSTSLTTLSLEKNSIAPSGITALAKNSQLQELELRENSVSLEAAMALATNPSITHLDLSDCQLDDKSIQAIVSNPRLKVLILNDTPLGEDALKALVNNTTLQLLDISSVYKVPQRRDLKLLAEDPTIKIIKGYHDQPAQIIRLFRERENRHEIQKLHSALKTKDSFLNFFPKDLVPALSEYLTQRPATDKEIKIYKQAIINLIKDFSQSLKDISSINFNLITEDDLKNDDSGGAEMLKEILREIAPLKDLKPDLKNSFIKAEIFTRLKNPEATSKAFFYYRYFIYDKPEMVLSKLMNLDHKELDHFELAQTLAIGIVNLVLQQKIDKIPGNEVFYTKTFLGAGMNNFDEFNQLNHLISRLRNAKTLDEIKKSIAELPDLKVLGKLKLKLTSVLEEIASPSQSRSRKR